MTKLIIKAVLIIDDNEIGTLVNPTITISQESNSGCEIHRCEEVEPTRNTENPIKDGVMIKGIGISNGTILESKGSFIEATKVIELSPSFIKNLSSLFTVTLNSNNTSNI